MDRLVKLGIVERIREPEYSEGSLLAIGIRRGSIPLINLALKNGSNVDKPNMAGQTPLMSLSSPATLHISVERRIDIIDLLMAKKAKIDDYAGNADQRTPLILAVTNGFTIIAVALLHYGANPNTQDSTGRTALHYAIELGNHAIIPRLIDAGADINGVGTICPPIFMTVLAKTCAYDESRIRSAKLLLKYGANPVLTLGGLTASQFAADNGLNTLSEMLEIAEFVYNAKQVEPVKPHSG